MPAEVPFWSAISLPNLARSPIYRCILLVASVVYTPSSNVNPCTLHSPLSSRYSFHISLLHDYPTLQAGGDRQRFDRERDVVHASRGGDANAAKLLMQQAQELQGKFTSTIQKHF